MAEVQKNACGYLLPNKVLYVEPNYSNYLTNGEVEAYFKKNDEDYCIYVDLQVEVFSRQSAFVNNGGNKKTILSWKSNDGGESFSFMQGKQYTFMGSLDNNSKFNLLTTDYTDCHYQDIVTGSTSEMFGIESIDIMYNNRQIPEVTIKFKDVRGASLFAPEDFRHSKTSGNIEGIADDNLAGSFFKSFFTFPWPRYTLLIKGFYGQPVTYELCCHDFKTNFDSSSGNFSVTAKFVGYDNAFLNDVSLNALIAAPNSDFIGQAYWESQQSNFKHLNSEGVYESGLPKITDIITDFKNFTAQVSEIQSGEGSPGRAITEKQQKLDDISQIKGKYDLLIKGLIEKIPSKRNVKLSNGETSYVNRINEENYGGLIVIDADDSKKSLLEAYKSISSTTSVESINKLINDFNEKYTENVSKIASIIDLKYIKLFVNNGERLKLNDVTEYKTYKKDADEAGFPSKVIIGTKELVENVNESVRKDHSHNPYYIYQYSKTCCYLLNNIKFITDIDNIASTEESVIKALEETVNVSLKKITIGGENAIVPNIENITRVLMAHLETYMHILKESAATIKKQMDDGERTPEKFGIDDNGIFSDVPIETTNKENSVRIGPWPDVKKKGAVVNQENDAVRYEDEWIGNAIKNGEETQEANVIRGLLNATKYIQETFTKIEEEDSNSNEESGNYDYDATTPSNTETQSKKLCIKYPIIPYDLVLDGNPFGSGQIDGENYHDIFSRIFMRMVNVLNLASNSSDFRHDVNKVKQIAKFDARSFFDKFGDNNVYEQDHKYKGFFVTLLNKNTFWDKPLLIESSTKKKFKLNKEVFEWCFPLQNVSLNTAIKELPKKPSFDNPDYINTFKVTQSGFYHFKNLVKIIIGDDLLKFNGFNTDDGEYNTFFNQYYQKLTKATEEGALSNFFYQASETMFDRKITDDIYNEICSVDKRDYSQVEIKGIHVIPKSKSTLNTSIKDRMSRNTKDITSSHNEIWYADSKNNRKSFDKRKNRSGLKEDLTKATSLKSSTLNTITIPSFRTYVNKVHVSQSYFMSNVFVKCKSNEAKLFCFLLGVNAGTLDKLISVNSLLPKDDSSIKIMPYFSALLYGGYKYISSSSDLTISKDFNEYIKPTVLCETNNEKNDAYFNQIFKGINITNIAIIDEFKQLFKKFADNEFKEIRNAYEFKFVDKEQLDINDMDGLRKAFRFESGAKKVSFYLDKLKDNFFENYYYYDNEACFLNRQDTPIMQKLLNWIFKPIAVIFPTVFGFTEQNELYNYYAYLATDDYGAGYYKTYFETFTKELKELHKKPETESATTEIPTDTLASESQNESTAPADSAALEEIARHIKIALYKYTKNFYDRWSSSGYESGKDEGDKFRWDCENIMKRFHFLDCYYNYIGDQCMINMESFYDMVLKSETDQSEESYYSLLMFINEIFYKSNVNMVCVQNFINLSSNRNKDNSGELEWIENMQKMFEPIPYMNIKKPEYSTQFVCMYKSETSKHLDIQNGEYKNDSFMINDGTKDSEFPLAIKSKTQTNGYLIPAFGVSYGSQYQSYFKDIDVSNDSPMMTEVALKAQFNVVSQTNGDKESFALGQDLYTIYANNSYTCTIKMMGCAWVQPLMYFCLTNVPLFRGTYLIEKVTHSVKPGYMETTITGVRMANTSVPFVDTPYLTRNNTNGGSSYYNPGNVNLKYKRGNVDNDCGYAVYTLEKLGNASEGGFDTEFLNKPMRDVPKHGNYFADDVKLIDALTWITYKEVGLPSGNQGRLGAGLVDTVLFNRIKNNKIEYIFDSGQFAVLKNQSNISTSTINSIRGIDEARNLLVQIMQSTPSILAGEIIDSTPNNYKDPQGNPLNIMDKQKVTVDLLQRTYGFYTASCYAKDNPKMGYLKFAFQHKGHAIFIDETKKYWEYMEKEELEKQKEEREGLSDFAQRLITAIQRTMDNTDETSGVKLSVQQIGSNQNAFFLTSSDISKNKTIFDIILQTYYDKIRSIHWVGKNSSTCMRENPEKIRVIVYEGSDTIKKSIGIGWTNDTNEMVRQASNIGSQYPHSLIKSINKRFNNINLIKNECHFFLKNTDEEIQKILSENKSQPCYTSSYNGSAEPMSFPPSATGQISSAEERDRFKALFDGKTRSEIQKSDSYKKQKTIKISTCNGANLSLTIHASLADEVIQIFEEIKQANCPVYAVGGHNWRYVNNGTNSKTLSMHSYGVAIDINACKNPNNPNDYLNPYPGICGHDSQPGVDDKLHIRTPNHEIVQIFLKHGWGWGGRYKDYMHFSLMGGH